MAKDINIAKVWNPNSYQDIGSWYKRQGYPEKTATAYTFRLGDSSQINNAAENQIFYTEIKSIYSNGNVGHSYELTSGFYIKSQVFSYPQVSKIIFAAYIKYNQNILSAYDSYSPFSIEFYTNYNRDVNKIHEPIENKVGNDSFSIGLHPFKWNVAYGLEDLDKTFDQYHTISSYNGTKLYPGDDVRSDSYQNRMQNEANWGSPYLMDNFILNINNPFMPVFDNEEDLFAYLDDYENEEKAAKALNYYDMSNDLSCDNERYKYKNLTDIMSSYKNKFENSNIYDFSSIDKEILTPLNNLILTYKGNNYNEKIKELQNKYIKQSYDYINLSRTKLIDSDENVIRQIEMPTAPALTAYSSFSKFNTTELNIIKQFTENSILSKWGSARDYLLMVNAAESFPDDDYNKIQIVAVVAQDNGDCNFDIYKILGTYWHYEEGLSWYSYYKARSYYCYFNSYPFKVSDPRSSTYSWDLEVESSGKGFTFYYDIEAQECTNLSSSNKYSIHLNKIQKNIIYGSDSNIYINNFNDLTPFYATADFYEPAGDFYVHTRVGRNDKPASSYASDDNYDETTEIIDGWYEKEVRDWNGAIEEIYYYDSSFEHRVARHLYNPRVLLFKTTPNIDPYADLPESGPGMILIKPIVTILNRYEMSNINGWDGNKLKMTDGYLLAPQIGAGKKSSTGLFTGVVMGVKQLKPNSNENQRIGMFGFNDGIQSLFLNAEDGSAIFGLPGKGQITIDPRMEKGLLYSGNYWRDYNTKDGKPKSYSNSNLNGQGMLIDLTTPEIRFGNGNFIVTKDGYVTAKGGGSIAGWRIGNSELYSNVTKGDGRLTLDSGSITLYAYELLAIYDGSSVILTIYCLVSSESQTAKIFYIKDQYNNIQRNFEFTYTPPHDSVPGVGTLRVQGYYSYLYNLGDLNLTTDTLIYNYVSGKSVVDTASNYQYPGKFYSHSHDSLSATNTGFYLSYDGFSIGSKFRIDSAGNLQATDALLTGTIHVTGNGVSTIGNWVVNSDNLYSRITRTSSPAGTFDITIGSDGNMFGKKLASVDPETGVETWETQWEIRRDGDCYFKNISGEVPAGKNLKVAGALTVSGSASVGGTLTVGDPSHNNGFTLSQNSITGANITISTTAGGQISLGAVHLTSQDGGINCTKLSASGNISCSSLTVNNNTYADGSITAITGATPDGQGGYTFSTTTWNVLKR